MKNALIALLIILTPLSFLPSAHTAIRQDISNKNGISARSPFPHAEQLIDLLVDAGPDGTRVVLIGDGPWTRYKVRALESPKRISLELYGVSSKNCKTYRVKNSLDIGKIRVVQESDHVRVDCYLSKGLLIFPHYTVTGEKVKLQIYFGDPARYIQTH